MLTVPPLVTGERGQLGPGSQARAFEHSAQSRDEAALANQGFARDRAGRTSPEAL